MGIPGFGMPTIYPGNVAYGQDPINQQKTKGVNSVTRKTTYEWFNRPRKNDETLKLI